jgi:hypothetical protein
LVRYGAEWSIAEKKERERLWYVSEFSSRL